MEIIITIVIFAAALFILARSVKKTAQGDCACGSCDSRCPIYDKKTKGTIEFLQK